MNRAKLEEQIGEMEYQLHKMREELNKPKKFEWKYIDRNAFYVSTTLIDSGWGIENKSCIEYGRLRKTQKAAEMSLARNKRANRLEALAEQLGGLKDFERGNENHYIYFNNSDNTWHFGTAVVTHNPGIVYMTEQCAKKICRMLNDGEFSLDGEI